ncbi:helicase BlpT [Streptococcus merionis]|uniref:helicase BlpT n=1 Tax=Streptococcus merionis TaxID=400065 RepID=UPI003518007F
MTSEIVIQAKKYISEFRINFMACYKARPDDERILRNIAEVESVLNRVNKDSNKSLVALERFYQSTSLIIGLGAVNLDEQSLAKWRTYDKFHYDYVKPNLKLYGPIVI